jgi:hypothetical protein
MGAIVYSTADRNQFFFIRVSILRRGANLSPPGSGPARAVQPGRRWRTGRWIEPRRLLLIQEKPVPAPLKMKSAAECLTFEKESFGALHTMLSRLTGKNAAWQEIEREPRQFESAAGFEGPCELIVISQELRRSGCRKPFAASLRD